MTRFCVQHAGVPQLHFCYIFAVILHFYCNFSIIYTIINLNIFISFISLYTLWFQFDFKPVCLRFTNTTWNKEKEKSNWFNHNKCTFDFISPLLSCNTKLFKKTFKKYWQYLISNSSLYKTQENFISGLCFPGLWSVSYSSQV